MSQKCEQKVFREVLARSPCTLYELWHGARTVQIRLLPRDDVDVTVFHHVTTLLEESRSGIASVRGAGGLRRLPPFNRQNGHIQGRRKEEGGGVKLGRKQLRPKIL